MTTIPRPAAFLAAFILLALSRPAALAAQTSDLLV